MSNEQNVGFGALLGGGSAILTNVLIRYFADNKMTQATAAGEQPSKPFVYEHSPLFGLLPTAAAAFAAYKWLGGAPAAVAAAICGLFASTAPPIDNWIVQARKEKDATEAAGAAGSGGTTGRFGSLADRMAGLKRAA